MKTNSWIVEYAKAQIGLPYWYGTFGQTATEDLYKHKKTRYPSYYTAGDFESQFGQRVHDCVGLVKGALWSDTTSSKPKYDSNQDKSAKGMYAASVVKGAINGCNWHPGVLLYKGDTEKGIHHVGIWDGSRIIEAKGHAYGVVVTEYKAGTGWDWWSQCPFAVDDYAEPDKTVNDIYGIDISHWQGAADLTNTGKSFVIAKVSQAEKKDANFDGYYNAFKGDFGAYVYSKVKTIEEARKEANFAVKTLSNRQLSYGVWLDLEDSTMQILGKEVLNKIVDAEADIITAAGYGFGIYCNKNWYYNVLDNKYLANKYPFWIARYAIDDNGTPKDSLSPKAFPGCVMWQYSSKGKVNGFSGNVDLDKAFTDIPALFKDVKKVEYYPAYVESLDNMLRCIGVPDEYIGSFSKRRPLALANGIVGYSGTKEQNLLLISLIKEGKLKKV